MEAKDLIGLSFIPLAVLAGVIVTCLSQRAREVAFFLLIMGAVFSDKLDVNFVSRYWYRGTTRGFEFSFLDVLAISLLVSSLLVPHPGHRRWFWPAGLVPLLLYFIYAGFSVAISEPKLFGLFELSKILRAIIVFLAAAMFVRGERELSLLVVALGCAVCFEGMLALKQRYVGGIYRVTGSVDHPNSLSMYLCMVAPLFVAAVTSNLPLLVRRFACVCIGFATFGLLLTISRAGIPIFALVMLGVTLACVSWRITARKILASLSILTGLALLLYASLDTLKARFGEATFEEEYLDEQSEGRGLYLRFAKAIIEDRFFGVGLNNWSYWVSKKYGPELGWRYEDYDDLDYLPNKELLPSFHYAAPAHNLAALTLGELGVPGLFLFTAMWMRWFHVGASFLWKRSASPMNRFGVAIFFGTGGIFLQSVTEWTYRQTAILFTFHILLGTLASLYFLRQQRKHQPVEQKQPDLEAVVWAAPSGALAGKN
jgi:hypothetical protein